MCAELFSIAIIYITVSLLYYCPTTGDTKPQTSCGTSYFISLKPQFLHW